MINKNHAIVKTLFHLFLLISLSGCASQVYYDTIPKDSPQEYVESTLTEPDSDLQETDQEMCLDSELNALSQSGIWNDPYSPMSFDPTENVFFDFPVTLNKQVEMYLHFFQNGFRDQFAQWLQRSGGYMQMMEAALAEAGLPRDLVYLAMIESGYNPLACSRSKAVGLWQFMENTGLQYNLGIDKYVDERRDPEKSTQAAVAFLADLYKEFGDWHLAVAAYNGGPGKIRNGLIKYKVDNFWDLASKDYLALETKRYVPKLIASLIIARQPEKFGFSQLTYHTPLKYDRMTVSPGMGLEAVALLTNSSVNTIKALNHELRQNRTPPNSAEYEIKIPYATSELAKKNLPLLHSIIATNYKSHKIGKKDTLASICAQYDVNTTTLLKANNLRSGKLSVGQSLRIPYNTISYQLLPENVAKARTARQASLVMHQVKAGDTVSKISKLHNVPPELIISWNGLKDVRSIQIGQQLALYIDQPATDLSEKTVAARPEKAAASEKNNKLVLKAEKRKAHITEGRATDAYASYNVKDGDTLYTISQKFSASTSEIKKWNNLKSDLIYPGDVLKLKKA